MDEHRERLFWAKVNASGPCWEWTAATNKGGYGVFQVGGGKTGLAHRVAYEHLVGEIPARTLDHLCRNTRCVNPDHLAPVSSGHNSLRSESARVRAYREGRCTKGHLLTPDNVDRQQGTYYTDGTPKVRCRTCHRAWRRKGA